MNEATIPTSDLPREKNTDDLAKGALSIDNSHAPLSLTRVKQMGLGSHLQMSCNPTIRLSQLG